MQLIIDRFSILSAQKERAFSGNFKSGINLIVGEKDTGKTTLARSILYTFGCDVKGLDLINESDNIYIVEFRVNDDKYILIRQRLKQGRGKNCFKLYSDKKNSTNTYYDTKTFKDELNELLSIKLVTLNKRGEETKLYPNHIFLPFYTDQDNSWQSYLKDTFTSINFISDYKKIILEYFTGARSNKYYDLKLQKDTLQQNLQNTIAIIKSKELIVEENLRNIKILEDIDMHNFKKNYEIVLKLYNSVIETEHQLKKEINQKIFEGNALKETENSLNNSIEVFIEENISKECPACHQSVINSLEENYNLLLAKQNLVKERERIKLELNDVQIDIDNLLVELNQNVSINKDYEQKLNADADVVSLGERADSYALSRINLRLEEELKDEYIKKEIAEKKLEVIETELRKLNSKNIASKYQKLMMVAFEKLNLQFAYKNYYNSNLESVNITLSGASKVQAFIAQYLTIYQMSVDNTEVINMPMFMDTFLKDDFTKSEREKTAQFIFSTLEDKHQSFIFIADNEETLNAVKGYSFTKLKLRETFNIFNKDYLDIYSEYKFIIE